jgi:hypothetical protein
LGHSPGTYLKAGNNHQQHEFHNQHCFKKAFSGKSCFDQVVKKGAQILNLQCLVHADFSKTILCYVDQAFAGIAPRPASIATRGFYGQANTSGFF